MIIYGTYITNDEVLKLKDSSEIAINYLTTGREPSCYDIINSLKKTYTFIETTNIGEIAGSRNGMFLGRTYEGMEPEETKEMFENKLMSFFEKEFKFIPKLEMVAIENEYY